MKGFILHLQAAADYRRIEGVTSLVAEDGSGEFGILAGHECLVTTLLPGIVRFRLEDAAWRYLAVPGSVLHFEANEMYIQTRRFLLGDDYRALSADLETQLLAEERALAQLHHSVQRMEEAMFKRLRQLGRGGP